MKCKEQFPRKKMKTWYIFQFLNLILLAWGSVFLYFCYQGPFSVFNYGDLIPTLLTIIGFLFAFAGINIYSIFNTNVEAEKKTLNDLSDEYREKLEQSVASVEHSKNIVRVQINIGMIVDPHEASFEITDMVDKVVGLIDKAISHIKDSRKDSETICEIEEEFRDIAQYNHRKLSTLLARIGREEEHGRYFRQIQANHRSTIINSLQKLNSKLADIVSGDIYVESETEETTPQMSFWAKIKSWFLHVWNYGFRPISS